MRHHFERLVMGDELGQTTQLQRQVEIGFVVVAGLLIKAGQFNHSGGPYLLPGSGTQLARVLQSWGSTPLFSVIYA
jgi:hypothetical protein